METDVHELGGQLDGEVAESNSPDYAEEPVAPEERMEFYAGQLLTEKEAINAQFAASTNGMGA